MVVGGKELVGVTVDDLKCHTLPSPSRDLVTQLSGRILSRVDSKAPYTDDRFKLGLCPFSTKQSVTYYGCVMPTGTPYNAFILPYPIRVDDFADTATLQTVPALHLLTHTHADHINGLSAKSFSATVFCSIDAKEMLLRHEVYAERALKEMDIRAENVRTFQHLRVPPKMMGDGSIWYHGSRDLLVSLFPPLL